MYYRRFKCFLRAKWYLRFPIDCNYSESKNSSSIYFDLNLYNFLFKKYSEIVNVKLSFFFFWILNAEFVYRFFADITALTTFGDTKGEWYLVYKTKPSAKRWLALHSMHRIWTIEQILLPKTNWWQLKSEKSISFRFVRVSIDILTGIRIISS